MGEQIGIVTPGPFDETPTEQLVDCVCTKDGLAVHQYPLKIFNNWTVTHVPSGLAIAKGGASEKDALAVMEELLPLTDWSQDQHDLPVIKIRKRALRIIERHGLVRGVLK